MGAPIVGIPRFELQIKLPPSFLGGVRFHTVEGNAEAVVGEADDGAEVVDVGAAVEVDDVCGIIDVDVEEAGAEVEVDVAGGFEEVDVVEDEEQDASKTTDNISARHRTMNLFLNNFFILHSL
jgi:hypothetical protein